MGGKGAAAETAEGLVIPLAEEGRDERRDPVPAAPRLFAFRGQLRRRTAILIALGASAATLLVWEAVARSGLANPLFLPAPSAVMAALARMTVSQDLLWHAWVSTVRVWIAFGIAAAMAIPIGMLMSSYRPVGAALEPIIDFIRYLPVPALVPLSIIWFGVGEDTKIFLLWLGTFFQLVLLVADDMRRVPNEYFEIARTVGANQRQLLTDVAFRAMLPNLVDSLRITLGWCWTYLIIAEIVAADRGLGFVIWTARRYMKTPEVMAGVVAIGIIGLITDQLLRLAASARLPVFVRRPRCSRMSHFERVRKRFGTVDVIAEPFSLSIPRNEFVVFLGPSGCGKTTLMRMAGGLDEPSSGVVTLLGEVIRKPDRRRGMVSQSYSSFPWLTVAENIAFGMRYRDDLSAAEKRERRDHYLALVGLTDFAGAYPGQVSGGMRQRIAIARTLAAGSEVLLMDEPFGALDAQRREKLQAGLRELHKTDATTVIFVTHDVEEAAFLADRVIIFSRASGQGAAGRFGHRPA